MNNKWIVIGNKYHLSEMSQERDILESGVFNLEFDDTTKKFYLSKTQDSYEFEYKVYGIETDFVNRVVKTYNNTTGNLGVLLTGLKGTGKTVTAELICNELKLPVIIINEAFDGLQLYLNNIQEDCILFFDEYEKFYSNYNFSILSIMDGALNLPYRKVFLLTTNDVHINTNMLQRPSRIRYVKTFTDLTIDVIENIVDDVLINKKHKTDIIKYISELDIITIDIVKSVCEEVNIHNESPNNFKDVFNVKASENIFNVYEIIYGKEITEKLKWQNVKVTPFNISNIDIGNYFKINDNYQGDIKSVLADGVITIEIDKDDVASEVTYRLEKVDIIHKSFNNYAF